MTTNPLPGYDDWKTTPPDFFDSSEDAAMTLTAEVRHDTWTVTDTEGGIWWPSEEAAAQINAADDPAAEAVRIADAEPMRGEWVN